MKKSGQLFHRRTHFFGKLKLWLAERTGEEETQKTSVTTGTARAPQQAPRAVAKVQGKIQAHTPRLTLEDVPHPTDDFMKGNGF